MAELVLTREEAEQELPPVCICCGKLATKWKRMQFEVAQAPPPSPQGLQQSLFETATAVIGLDLLVSLFRAAPAVPTWGLAVNLPVCRRHQNHWRWRNLVIYGGLSTWFLLFVGGVVISPLAGCYPTWQTALSALTAPAMMAFFVWGMTAAWAYETSVRLTEVAEDGFRLQGVSDRFLRAVERQRAG